MFVNPPLGQGAQRGPKASNEKDELYAVVVFVHSPAHLLPSSYSETDTAVRNTFE